MLEVVNHKIQDGRRNIEEVGLHESLKPKKIGKLGRAELRLADCESWCSSKWLIGTMQETLQVKLHVIMSAHFAYCGTGWDSFSSFGLWGQVPGTQFCMAWGERGRPLCKCLQTQKGEQCFIPELTFKMLWGIQIVPPWPRHSFSTERCMSMWGGMVLGWTISRNW